MGWRFVKQPDGKLAIFSDVVDDFTHYDLTYDEAIDICINEKDLGKESAEKKVLAGMDDIEPWGTKKGDGSARWNDSMNTILTDKGSARLRKTLDEMGLLSYMPTYSFKVNKNGTPDWIHVHDVLCAQEAVEKTFGLRVYKYNKKGETLIFSDEDDETLFAAHPIETVSATSEAE